MQTSNASFMNLHNSQTNSLMRMRDRMNDLQRQMVTQKKFENLGGFGLRAGTVLQNRAENGQLKIFTQNIDRTKTRINLMNDNMTQIASAVRQMAERLSSEAFNLDYDMELINNEARQLLDYVTDLANLEYEGRHIFAGTDVANAPITGTGTPNAQFQLAMTNWLNGTNTTTQLINNSQAMAGTDLGFSTTIASARQVSVRVDTSIEMSYGAIADQVGIDDAIRALTLISNLKRPDPATDAPDDNDYQQIVSYVRSVANNAANKLETAQTALGGKLNLLNNLETAHQNEIKMYSTLIEKEENADMLEVVTLLQSLQTQLTASYEVSGILSQLSLANIL